MTDPARLTDEALDTVLAALFDRHPHMQVAAVSPEGLFVPIPASVPFTTQTVLDRHTTALQFVLPDELVATIDAWEQAVQLGAAHIQVHLISDPEHTVVMHFVDARHRHGVLMCCVTGQRTTDDDATTADNGIRPRLAVMHKDERAVIRRVDDATHASSAGVPRKWSAADPWSSSTLTTISAPLRTGWTCSATP